uniref:Uncharacterized protein n=1 Tax=Cucumis melo TaxID=3656 RepID=A0A9I9EEE6_CUCME
MNSLHEAIVTLNLLLVGPLPHWQHPPPLVDSVNILSVKSFVGKHRFTLVAQETYYMREVMNIKIYKIGKMGQQSHSAGNEFNRFLVDITELCEEAKVY